MSFGMSRLWPWQRRVKIYIVYRWTWKKFTSLVSKYILVETKQGRDKPFLLSQPTPTPNRKNRPISASFVWKISVNKKNNRTFITEVTRIHKMLPCFGILRSLVERQDCCNSCELINSLQMCPGESCIQPLCTLSKPVDTDYTSSN